MQLVTRFLLKVTHMHDDVFTDVNCAGGALYGLKESGGGFERVYVMLMLSGRILRVTCWSQGILTCSGQCCS